MSAFHLSLTFAFLAMILWGFGDFMIQKTVRKIGDLQTLFWINLTAGLVLLPFIMSDLKAILSWPNIAYLVAMTAIDLLYSIFMFKAYDKGKLSVVEVVMIGELPFTIILGLIFFQEKLSILQWLAIVLIISGVFYISRRRKTWLDRIKESFGGKKTVWEKGVFLAIAAFIFSAIYNFMIALSARNISAFAAVWFPWTLSSLILFFYMNRKQGIGSLQKNSLGNTNLILLTALVDVAAWVCYALATSQEEISIITAIVAGYAVIAMALGVRYNNEQIGRWQYFGAAMVFCGVAIMSLISG